METPKAGFIGQLAIMLSANSLLQTRCQRHHVRQAFWYSSSKGFGVVSFPRARPWMPNHVQP
jgi:hypothetical protein